MKYQLKWVGILWVQPIFITIEPPFNLKFNCLLADSMSPVANKNTWNRSTDEMQVVNVDKRTSVTQLSDEFSSRKRSEEMLLKMSKPIWFRLLHLELVHSKQNLEKSLNLINICHGHLPSLFCFYAKYCEAGHMAELLLTNSISTNLRHVRFLAKSPVLSSSKLRFRIIVAIWSTRWPASSWVPFSRPTAKSSSSSSILRDISSTARLRT